MKPARRTIAAILAVACVTALGITVGRAADDPVKVAPSVYKVLIDNDRVRVLEATLKPGEKVPMHSHPANVVYPLDASKARFTTPDGKSVDVELKPGEATWHEAETHASENLGGTSAHVLVFELKEPSKSPKK